MTCPRQSLPQSAVLWEQDFGCGPVAAPVPAKAKVTECDLGMNGGRLGKGSRWRPSLLGQERKGSPAVDAQVPRTASVL